VLLVACANVAALLASRAPARARDIALRLAIGASRLSLLRQLLAESLAIGLAGTAAGLAVAYAGIVFLRQIELPSDIAALPPFELDRRALVFSLAIAVGSALLFGLGPALSATRVDLNRTLKAIDLGMAPRKRMSGRNLLVSVQIALSLVLLTIALFAVQVFNRMLADGPRFRTERMAKITIDASGAGGDRESIALLVRAAEDARRLPSVTSVGLTARMPFSSFGVTPVHPEGYRPPAGSDAVPAYTNAVDEGYFRTLEIGVAAGRDFRATDDADAPRVAIVNEAFARKYWPSGNAVGRRLRLGDAGDAEARRLVEIVGVVRMSTYLYPGEPPLDMVYVPLRQQPAVQTVLLAATTGDSIALLGPLRDMVRRLPCCPAVPGGQADASVPVYDVQTSETFYGARATQLAGVLQTLIVSMGLMGLTLSAVALYGLVSYSVSHRTREIAIRAAVGADGPRILRMVMAEGMRPVWVGLAAGLVLSVLTARVIPALAPLDHQYEYNPVLNVLVIPAVIAVTLVAAFVPARRATRVEPTVALRSE
jgi:putative ABC transport system permease protein